MQRIKIFDLDGKGIVKAVQLYIRREPYLALGRTSHGLVLDQILEDMQIPFEKEWRDREHHAKREDGKNYEATGMIEGVNYSGNEILLDRKKNSIRYGRGFDQEHWEKIQQYISNCKFNIVLI